MGNGLAIKHAFTKFAVGRDMLLGTAIALLTLAIQVREHLIPIADWQEHKAWWILSFVIPYIVVLGGHAIWRMALAPWWLYRKAENDHAAEVKVIEEKNSDAIAIAAEQHRQALQAADQVCRSLRVELSAAQEQLAAAKCDWPAEWKDLSRRFEAVIIHRLRADWHHTSAGEGWMVTGGDPQAAHGLQILCGFAGKLLVSSPRVSTTLPSEISSCPDPISRWLFYLKHVGHGYDISWAEAWEVFVGKDDVPERRVPVHGGSIRDLAGISATQCIACAAQEI